MNELEKQKAENFSLLALSLLEIVLKKEFNNSWNDRFEDLFTASLNKVIFMLENHILRPEYKSDGLTINYPEGSDNLRDSISVFVTSSFNDFKRNFKNNNNE